jgi:outer membrane protein assembly factor BamB
VLIGVNGALLSFDATGGKVLWTVPQTGDLDQIAYRAGWVITSAGSTLGAFRAEDGSVIWQENLGPAVVGAPAIDGDGVFIVLSDGKLMRVSILTGEITWTVQLDGWSSPPFAANERVYVSLSDGHFEAFDQQKGHLLWWYQFSGPSIGASISDTEHVYVALADNTIRAMDRHVGNQRWQAQLTERPASGPLLAAENVLLPSAGGEIGIARRKDGHVVARIVAPAAPADVPGATPRLIALATAPGDVLVRLVANGDTTLTLAAYHRAPPKDKKKTPTTGQKPGGLPSRPQQSPPRDVRPRW